MLPFSFYCSFHFPVCFFFLTQVACRVGALRWLGTRENQTTSRLGKGLSGPLLAQRVRGRCAETVQYNNIKFQVWDLGGQTSISVNLLQEEELRGAAVLIFLIFANKHIG
ncbi:hypothetical protein E1A91_D07G163000v1 [Gossypium mustelinum]|uniref:Uncharacterized protein n=2 Tax=Gossypium TaxID=3633 RepID=A0A5D2UBJ0_GOSMU|nr:hypothetical protein E1A91_D07G163000v1 [Gossypium mustelinum]